MNQMPPDIRWVQRFQNYTRALTSLSRAVKKPDYSELESQGVIQSFEYCFELAWKTLQDLIEFKGFSNVLGPRPVIQKAFELGLVSDGHEWLLMIKSRNLTSHTYDEKKANEIVALIKNRYFLLFQSLAERLQKEVALGNPGKS